MVVEGPDDNTWELVRTLMGATKVDDAEPGTIRGDFATITTENLVHGSRRPRVGRARDRALVPQTWLTDCRETRDDLEADRSTMG